METIFSCKHHGERQIALFSGQRFVLSLVKPQQVTHGCVVVGVAVVAALSLCHQT